MNKEQEPEFLASISLSKEEIVNRQRPVGIPRRQSLPGDVGRPMFLWGVVLLLLVAVVTLVVQLQLLKKQSGLQLQALQVLQHKLTSTDEQANLSVDAIKILLKEQDHEIRKLWDLANKRNKKNIEKHKERLDDQSKLLTKQAGQIDQVSKRTSEQKKSVVKLGGDVEQVVEQTAVVSAEMKALKKTLKQSSQSLATLKKSIGAVPDSVQKELNSLSTSLRDLSKVVDAMDATRLHHNKRLNKLESSFKTLSSGSKSPAPAAVSAQ